MTLIERSFRERIVLVGMSSPDASATQVARSLDELALLVDTAGADVMARVVQYRDAPDPATYVGKGKANEIRDLSYEVDADTVVFDDELTPAQQRNLEKIFGRTAIDRTAVILDIFAQNARTRVGKTQVELALLRYRLPRLRGKGHQLSQQAGRIGTRGPGETKLEEDRRRLLRRMSHLEHELASLATSRETGRKARTRGRNARVSFVGYTNAGKSTLLNAITGATAVTEDRLFSTLDPLTRRGVLPGGEAVLFSDTVGFVRKLPHQLVEAFRSTLVEVNDADVLVHVVDVSSDDPLEEIAAVHAVLDEIGTGNLREIMVFNKSDRLSDVTTGASGCRAAQSLAGCTGALGSLRDAYPDAVVVSARTGEGVGELVGVIGDALRAMQPVRRFAIPHDRGDVLALLHREAEVLVTTTTDTETVVDARLDEATFGAVSRFAVAEGESDEER